MRLQISKSKNSARYYVIKTIYLDGKEKTKIFEKLGTHDELLRKLDGQDPKAWAEKHIEELNRMEEEESLDTLVKYSPKKLILKGEQRTFNGGYLFLQKIYRELRLDELCGKLSQKYKFTYILDSILSRLLYSRIIYPSSKLATFKLSQRYFEQPDFQIQIQIQIQHLYRSLEVLSNEFDFIQETLYNNSLKLSKRNTGVLYYDCTNYFFEIEQEEGLRQYGFGKDHKPNPIIGMGMFMDGDGIPLAFSIFEGNTNEQVTLRPLEQKILSDFGLSRFVVCTDAGLASDDNRKFNSKGDRAFITTQPVKKLKAYLKKWALDPEGWLLDDGSKTKDGPKTYDITKLDDEGKYKDRVFYKERWVKDTGLEQRLIVTYSVKYFAARQKKLHRKHIFCADCTARTAGRAQEEAGRTARHFLPHH